MSTNFLCGFNDDTWPTFEPFLAENLPMPPVLEEVRGDTEEITTRKGAVQPKKAKQIWSSNQLAVLHEAIRNANGNSFAHKEVVAAVNQFAEAGDGTKHSLNACLSKIYRITIKENLKKVIDPTGGMSQREIKGQLRRPIEGKDLERLIELHNEGKSIYQIALELKRSYNVCLNAIRKLKQSDGVDPALPAPQPPEEAQQVEMAEPGLIPFDKDYPFEDFASLYPESSFPTTPGPQSSGKREIDPEPVPASKRVKVGTVCPRQKNAAWSENQIKVIADALERANTEPIGSYDPIFESVNALAAQGDGGFHNITSCVSKMVYLREEGRIRMAIDPTGTMSESKIKARMNMPIKGHDLDYLIQLHKKGKPVFEMAVVLKRKPGIIKHAIKQYKAENPG